MKGYRLTVGGLRYPPRKSGIDITALVEGRSAARFDLLAPVGAFFVKGQPVQLYASTLSDFEAVGATDWILGGVGTGLATIDAMPNIGAHSLKITNPSSGNYGTSFNRVGVPVTGLSRLLITTWIKATAGGPAGPFRITFANPGANVNARGVASAQPSAQAGVSVVDFIPTVSTGFWQYGTTVNVPAGYAFAFIEIYQNSAGSPAAAPVWFNDIWVGALVFGGRVDQPKRMRVTPPRVKLVPGLLATAYADNGDLTSNPAPPKIVTSVAVLPQVDRFGPSIVDDQPGSGRTNFSQHIEGFVIPRFTETYTFYVTTDDGARLWVNGVQLLNSWVNQGPTTYTGTIALTAGVPVALVLEHYQGTGPWTLAMEWSSASQTRQIIPPGALVYTDPGQVLHQIGCVDDHYHADKLIVAKSWVGQTCGFMVNDLITTYLAAEGITAGNVEAGPVVTQQIYNYIPCSAALDDLAKLANFTWWIFDGKLYFQSYSSQPAPWAVTNSDVFQHPPPNRDDQAPLYRNRQYIKGFKDITATMTESFHGDAVRRAFALGFPIAIVPSAVTVNSVAKTLGIKQIDTGKDWYWSKGDNVLVQDSAGTLLLATDTLAVTYQGLFEGITVSTDTAAVTAQQLAEGSGSGFVDNVFDLPNVGSRQAAFDQAGKFLSMYARLGSHLKFLTIRPGLQPGQLALVTLPEYGYAATQLLVCGVRTTDSTGFTADKQPVLVYEVEAVAGPFNGSWAKFFERMVQPAGIPIQGTGLVQMLTTLNVSAETWAWTETAAPVVHACFAADGLTLANGLSLACD